MEQRFVPCYEEDEVDLREIVNTIKKRKWFILIFTFILTFFSICYVFFATPEYEAKALIEIGNYKADNKNGDFKKVLLDDNKQLVNKLKLLYIESKENLKNRKSEITNIIVPKGSKELIEITSLAISNSLAVKEINSVLSYIQSMHNEILEIVKKKRSLQMKNIDAKINIIIHKQIPLLDHKIDLQTKMLADFTKQIKLIEKTLKKMDTNQHPSFTALKLMEKKDLLMMVMKLNNQLIDMRTKRDKLATISVNSLEEEKLLVSSSLLPNNYKNTAVVGHILTDNTPVKPNKKLIILVTFITSFILSIMLIFLFEVLKNDDR